MDTMLTTEQNAEMETLRKKHTTLAPEAVVNFASSPKTALHSRFTWDDSEAAQQYRLWQARQVLRVMVYTPKGSTEPVRAMVSLRDDRTPDKGYRSVAAVLRAPDLRAAMLEEALAELQVFRRKYKQLTELAGVFEAAANVRRRTKPSNGRKSQKKRETASASV